MLCFDSGDTCRLQEGKGEGYVQEERRRARRVIYVMMKIIDSVLQRKLLKEIVFFHILSWKYPLFSDLINIYMCVLSILKLVC